MKSKRKLSANTRPSIDAGEKRKDGVIPLVPHVPVHIAQAEYMWTKRLIRVTTTSIVAESGSTLVTHPQGGSPMWPTKRVRPQ